MIGLWGLWSPPNVEFDDLEEELSQESKMLASSSSASCLDLISFSSSFSISSPVLTNKSVSSLKSFSDIQSEVESLIEVCFASFRLEKKTY